MPLAMLRNVRAGHEKSEQQCPITSAIRVHGGTDFRCSQDGSAKIRS
jgi:hypothetical protein